VREGGGSDATFAVVDAYFAVLDGTRLSRRVRRDGGVTFVLLARSHCEGWP